MTLLWSELRLHVVRHPELAPKLAARQRAGRAAIAQVIAAPCDQPARNTTETARTDPR